ncbi:MAG TPA: pseudaminic acid cytidylyltransferase [bacterium]|nr:pseudaminic acid cytidylyltransferase [bacterium]
MNVAIIPARSGSKRIPGKNIKSFAGKSIISYSIAAAKITGLFDRIIVSTNSNQIAEIARQYGAEVPFRRPSNLSDDNIDIAPVVEHAINWLNSKGQRVKYFCNIYPTAPFIRPDDLRDAFSILRDKKAAEVFSVTTFPFPVFRALRVAQNGHLEMFWPENELKRSQDLEEAYQDAGQFYWFDSEAFLKNKKNWDPGALPFFIPRYLVQDIDTPEDWQRAELMFEVCRQKGLL